mgnify:CR=1 FL=1
MMTQHNMPARAWFITGTDTEIGKTYATCALLHVARAQGLTALGMKPVAAGTEMVGGERLNEDVAALRAASSFDPGLALLNPWCLASPIAPHIAAAEEGVRIYTIGIGANPAMVIATGRPCNATATPVFNAICSASNSQPCHTIGKPVP